MKARVRATQVPARDLKPGDLFTRWPYGPAYWRDFGMQAYGSVGERAYIRTNAPVPEDELNEPVWKLEIVHEDEIQENRDGGQGRDDQDHH